MPITYYRTTLIHGLFSHTFVGCFTRNILGPPTLDDNSMPYRVKP
jgi:hypothetical protein